MTEYIKREVLKKRFAKRLDWLERDIHDEYSGALYDCCKVDIDLIDEIPAADVAPVVHGRWIEKWDLYDKGFYISRKVWYECSNCGMKTHYRDECFEKKVDYNYCPNCGAKMDGGADLEDD